MAIQKPIFVPINGLSTSPSDYLAKDGELAAALGVYHNDGVVSSAADFSPAIVVDELYNDKILYRHKGSSFDHLIAVENLDAVEQLTYYWMNNDDHREHVTFPELDFLNVRSVVAIGDSLVFYTDDAAFYYRWDGNQYFSLGSSLPEPSLSFTLTAHPYRALEDMHGADVNNMSGNNLREYLDSLTSFSVEDHNILIKTGPITLEGREAATNAAFADINYFQGKWCSEHGYFSQPFLLRYAFRLFDGTLTKHSAPILMLPSMGINPLVFIMAKDYYDSTTTICIDTVGVAASLRYCINNIASGLTQWRDIIQGIEIFVSAPIYTYDASKQCESMEVNEASNLFYDLAETGKTCAHNANEAFDNNLLDSVETMLERFSQESRFRVTSARGGNTPYLLGHNSVNRAVCFYKSGITQFSMHDSLLDDFTSTGYGPSFRIVVPERTASAIVKDIRECSNFYQILSIPFDDILDGKVTTGEWHDAEIEDGALGSLVAREAMTDDYDSHHTIIPSGVSEYNNRLNIFNVEKRFFNGFNLRDAYQRTFRQVDTNYLTHFYTIVYCNDNATKVICKRQSDVNLQFNASLGYFFYPDPSAKRVIQFGVLQTGEVYKRQFSLREHVGLNGAVYFESIENSEWKLSDNEERSRYWEDESGASSITYPNIVYTSEVSNPFVSRAANVEQIGNGEIIAMVPAAQPLSQGQFGDFPMYAFTTEGIWALYPNETGGWRSKQPISRDVVLSKEAILQLDQSVVFATSRGLMEIAGSRVSCISENFDGYSDMFFEDNSSHLYDLIVYHTDITGWSEDMTKPFREFIANCRMVYDYPHQRIFVGNPDYPFSFVFNMKDKVWTAIPLRILEPVNSYPQAYAMVEAPTNKLVDFADTIPHEDAIIPYDGFILTRPLKFGLPDTLKTIRSINVRGNFAEVTRINPTTSDEHRIDLVLYGSNDPAMRKWRVLESCHGPRLQFRYGTPFKAFRLAILTHLDSGESIAGFEVQVETKETDKIR